MAASVWNLRDNATVRQGQRPTWEEFARDLGQAMLRARTEKRLSQERVAHLAGITAYTYQKFEKGESRPGAPMNPRLTTLVSLSQVLEVALVELLPAGSPEVPTRL